MNVADVNYVGLVAYYTVSQKKNVTLLIFVIT